MLIGEYRHSIDSKHRLSLPAKFRRELGRKVVITHGLDHCLFVYPVRSWIAVAEKLGKLSVGRAESRGFNRFILAGAVEADVDSIGRILIPDFLRSFANLKEKVVIAGVHDRVEIWDEDRWKAYKSGIESDADRLAETLGQIGAL